MCEDEAAQALSRRERERLAHRREILEAAERVFARNGYYGATVEQIAQEAEFAVGTLYNFFKSKEDLYEQVVVKLTDEFMAVFRERVLAEEDPIEAIGALIELRLRLFEEHRGFARVFFESMAGGHVDPALALPAQLSSLYDEFVTSVTSIFERGICRGAFLDVDPLYLALTLHGVVNAFTAYWAHKEPEEPLAERVAKFKEMFIGRILREGGVDRPSVPAEGRRPRPRKGVPK
jgi:AcrR family transcriptional regulator